jgi:hypothetical protein
MAAIAARHGNEILGPPPGHRNACPPPVRAGATKNPGPSLCPYLPDCLEEAFSGLCYKAIERELLVIENLDATAEQLGLRAEDMLAKARSYIGRFGHYKAPFGVAVEVAKDCCEGFTLMAGLGDLLPPSQCEHPKGRIPGRARIARHRGSAFPSPLSDDGPRRRLPRVPLRDAGAVLARTRVGLRPPAGPGIAGGGASPPPSGSLSVSFVDVGQGDGVLVQAGGEDYLVDAGRAEQGPDVVDFLRGRGVGGELEGIVVSNPDADHIGGFLDVFDAFEVETVYASGDPKGTLTYGTFLRAAREEGSRLEVVRAGRLLDWGGVRTDT